MKTSLTKLSGLKRELTVELPMAVLQQKTDKILQNIASQAKLDGFRKGKIPLMVIRQKFTAGAKSDAANDLFKETLTEALKAAKVNPAGYPTLKKIDTEGKIFCYTLEFDVFPEVKLKNFGKLKISQIKTEITQVDEEKVKTDLRDKAAAEGIETDKIKTDDELAQKLGEKNWASLFEKIKQNMQLNAKTQVDEQNKNAVFDALSSSCEFDVPSASVAQEANALLLAMQQSLKERGIPEQNKLSVADFNAEAIRRVRLGLIIRQIIAAYKLSVNQAQISQKLTQMSKNYGKNAQKMLDYYQQNPDKLANIQSLVMEQMVVDLVLNKAKITTISKNFEQLMSGK